MSRILLATMPFTGHVSQGLPLARELAACGHEVRWYTGATFKSLVRFNRRRLHANAACS